MLLLTLLAFVMVWGVLLLGADEPDDARRWGERELTPTERGEWGRRS
jgi:hypothetical protein